MSIVLLRSRSLKVGPKKCAEFDALPKFKGQRKLRQPHVQTLVAKHELGLFLIGNLSVAHLNGHSYIVNGQHTKAMIERVGVPVQCHVDEFQCDTKEDLWKLYGTFDHHRRRNLSDTVRAARASGDMPGSIDTVQLGILTRSGKAIAFADRYPDIVFHGSDETMVVDAIKAHPDEVEFVAQFGRDPLSRRLGVNIAMVLTYRANQSAAQDFWLKAIDADNCPKSHPAMRLHKDLIRGVTAGNVGIGQGPVANREYYFRCISWWNTHRTGKPRTRLTYKLGSTLPKVKGL